MINCAFLVGCKKYKGKHVSVLEGIYYDIVGMQQALVQYCDCSSDDIAVIGELDDAVSPPTSYGLIDTITNTASKYKNTKINNLFFYYSGHGYFSGDDDSVMLLADSMRFPVEHGTLSLKKIKELILVSFKSIQHIIVILDMCLDGPIAKGGFEEEKSISTDYYPGGFIVFRSCMPGSHSFMIPEDCEELGKGSVFTAVFLEALEKNDLYTVHQISSFIKERIKHYNKTIGIRQKPFTSLQDDTLGNVLIKKKETVIKDEIESTKTTESIEDFPEDDITLISFEELQEFQSANILNEEFNEDEIRLIFRIVDLMDCNNLPVVSLMGQSTLDHLDKLYNEPAYDKYKISFDMFKTEKDTLEHIHRLTTSEARGILSIIYNRGPKNYDIDIEDSAIERSIDEIKKSIETCRNNYLKNANTIDRTYSSGLSSLKELALYITIGTIVFNRNQANDTSLLENVLVKLRTNYSSFKEYQQFLNDKQKMCFIHALELKEFLRKITKIEPLVFKNKLSFYYMERYNSDALSELLEILDQIKENISVYSKPYPHH